MIQTPDGSIAAELVYIVRREISGHQRRVGPVEKARLQTMMLSEREPVPDRAADIGVHFQVRVLLEIAQHVAFQLGQVLIAAAEACQAAGAQIRIGAAHSAKDDRRAEPLDAIIPRPLVDLVEQMSPTRDANATHRR